MQTVSQEFLNQSRAAMRKLNWQVRISFTKQFDDSIDFFTIGESQIGGGDFIPGAGDVAQEWDKYTYSDYSNRLISMEWVRQVDQVSSVSLAMADIVLANYDNYFTPSSGSEIDQYILPYRPIRLYAGFGDEVVPVFIGITEKMPVIDEKRKTATFHCIDFMYSLLNRPLNETLLLTDQRVDEVLMEVFQAAGIATDQVEFDEAEQVIPYAFFAKGTKLMDAARGLMEAEQGRLYMDENGIIRFKVRSNYSSDSVYSFDAYSNIIDARTRNQDDIINVVEVTGRVRRVQPKQKYWEQPIPVIVPANSSIDYWASFQDPVTTVDDPVYETTATSSFFTVNEAANGSGAANPTAVTLTQSDLFANSLKMVFTNSSSTDLYITELVLFATPVVVVQEIYVREEDEESIAKFDERPFPAIDNDFFQDETDARNKAIIMLRDYSNFGSVNELDVKGNMALQIDDQVHVDIFGRAGDYKITKMTNKITIPARFTQLLSVKDFTPAVYFTIGVSLIGGEDSILP